ncbi:MAG: hypothetical protein ABR498_04875 [Candidatus Dormibacteria bacterium]
MTASSVVAERTARRISPLFFLGGIICFFFTFAGVSCNSSALTGVLGGAGLNGPGTPAASPSTASCINALQDRPIVSYSGLTLVFGGTPDVLTTLPSECPEAGPQVTSQVTDVLRSGSNLGVQPLEVVAAIALVLGLALAVLGLFGMLRGTIRLPLGALFSLLALSMALLEQARLHTAAVDKLNALAAQQGAPFSVASYVTVNNGDAYIILLVVMGIGALYQLAAGFFGESAAEASTRVAATPAAAGDSSGSGDEPAEHADAPSARAGEGTAANE